MTSALCYLTITEAAKLIETKTLSPVELTNAFIRRIEAIDERLNSYVMVTSERALSDAQRAEKEIMAGYHRGALHGIPIAVKDIYATKGIRTTCCSRSMLDNVPVRDATAVKLLGEGGAVLLGKQTTHEFAFGGPSFDLPFPPARNPWDTECFTGGSSSGSAAGVAAGLCMGSLGSDTTGSIRTPATFCGVVGLKPTYGRISRTGVFPLAVSLDHCGVFAWTVKDAALMLKIVAGYDPTDPTSRRFPVPDYTKELTGNITGTRVGLIRHFYTSDETANNDVCVAVDAAADLLRHLGASVGEVHLSSLQDYHACCMIIQLSEGFAAHEHSLRERPEDYGEIAHDRLLLGGFVGAVDYIQALRLRAKLTAEVDSALRSYDVLVTAGSFDVAPPIRMVPKYSIIMRPLLPAPFNLSKHPAISVCCGFNQSGLPLGIQIAGRTFDEVTVLKVAHAYEAATTWRNRRPQV
jgi:aspartyl-tRNA(Asn)/glutamyl-tRNA(Gln) amidotransferase subunit A